MPEAMKPGGVEMRQRAVELRLKAIALPDSPLRGAHIKLAVELEKEAARIEREGDG
jgi:hypothetical protein